MARVKLTAGRIRDFSCPSGDVQIFLWDSEVPGLAVRATPGAKAFVFQGKLAKKTLRITIGDVRVWAIDDARGEARRLQGLIDQGIDPRQEKKERIEASEAKRAEEERRETTVGEAWSLYIEARRHKWGTRHLVAHEKAVLPGGKKITRGRKTGQNDTTQPGMLHPLVELKLSELTSTQIQEWLVKANERGRTEAAKMFRLLRAFISWCNEQERFKDVVDADVCKVRHVRDHVKRVTAKDDCLQREQLAPWFTAVRKITPPKELVVGSMRCQRWFNIRSAEARSWRCDRLP